MVTLAAGGDIRGQFKSGIDTFSGWLTANAGIVNAMRVLGGLIIIIAVVILLAKKYKPNSQLGQVDVSAKGLVCGALLAVLLVVPEMGLGLIGTIGGWCLELVYNIANGLFG